MTTHRSLDPEAMALPDRHQMLLGAVAPRPIAFVGTVDADGTANLSPYSFFNAFGANPVHIAFSPAYRGTDGSSKDTLRNVLLTKQFTVSIVSWAMVEQMNLSSAEVDAGVDEFDLAGFTKLASEKVKPPGVAESPFVMECELVQHIELGGGKASGNLVLGRVVMFRARQDAMDERGRLDPVKLDQVARLGASWYTRAKVGLFELPKPKGQPVGFEALPNRILESSVLTGNDLARLASVLKRPDTREIEVDLEARYGDLPESRAHEQIQMFLDAGYVDRAWGLVEVLERRRGAA